MTDRTCSIEGCEGLHCARGWCKRHYYAWKRNGDPLAFAPQYRLPCRASLEDRFWSKVDMNGPVPDYAPHLGNCWIWRASLDTHGYGRFSMGGRSGSLMGAHVVAYKLLVGPVPDGLELDHLCRNPPCCRPAHLEPVTHAVNMTRRMEANARCPAGHQYDEANTRMYRGHKQCRACDREFAAERRANRAPGSRSAHITVKLTSAEMAAVDAVRGDEPRSAWIRSAALLAPPAVAPVPGGGPRPLAVLVLVTEDEAAKIDYLRGPVLRSPWMRTVALAAAAA